MTTGIDISKHNGIVDWSEVKNEIDFAILRAGYGREASQKDIKFEENYKNAKTNKIPLGTYWYSYALSVDEIETEARVFLKTIAGKTFEYPVYLDIEESKQAALSKTTIEDMINAFCSIVEKEGYFVGVYSYDGFFSKLSENITGRYALWVANTSTEPKRVKSYGIHQYSFKGKVNGVSGDVDMNKCYVDYPTVIKAQGLNGFSITKKATKAATALLGDFNKDGVVDDKDIEALQEYIKTIENKAINGVNADLNNDGDVNQKDLTILQEERNKNVGEVQIQETKNYPSLDSSVKTYSYSKDGNTFLSPHFQVKEFGSTNGSKIYSDNVLISGSLVNMLEKLYTKLQCTAIHINSGYRTTVHDKIIGGSGSGQHVLGKAADIVCYNKDGVINSKIVCCVAADLGFGGVANISGRYQATHVDVRTNSKYYGDEIRGYSSIWNYNSKWKDFYIYFGLSKDEVAKYTI